MTQRDIEREKKSDSKERPKKETESFSPHCLTAL
jgi:hypothetical protein